MKNKAIRSAMMALMAVLAINASTSTARADYLGDLKASLTSSQERNTHTTASVAAVRG